MHNENTFGSKAFDIVNYSLLMLFAIVTIIPFIHIISGSFATTKELLQKGFILFPTEFSLEAYRYIFSTDNIKRSLNVSAYITICGTAINMLFTVLFAYPLAHSHIKGRKVIMSFIVFTMVFGPGMIANFLTIKSYGLMNSLWALMLPGAINTFNLIVLKNFFQQIPAELEESAKIDGCNDLRILFQIIIPLSAPALATIALFYAVAHWNNFMSAIIYLNDAKKWPIQVILRQVVIASQGGVGMQEEGVVIPTQTVKMAVITVATAPILIVYPFLQKYFTKGVMLGSVKG